MVHMWNGIVKPTHSYSKSIASASPGSEGLARASEGDEMCSDGFESALEAVDTNGKPANHGSLRSGPRNNACSTERGSFGALSTTWSSSSEDDASRSVMTIPV
jgi:hypothetical protein